MTRTRITRTKKVSKTTVAAIFTALTTLAEGAKLTLKGSDGQLYSASCEPALRTCESFVADITKSSMQLVKNTNITDAKAIAHFDCQGAVIEIAQSGNHALNSDGEYLQDLLSDYQTVCTRIAMIGPGILLGLALMVVLTYFYLYLVEQGSRAQPQYEPIPDHANPPPPEEPAPNANRLGASYQQGPG